jgi:uncharacterized protein (TIGR03067 family)
MLIRTIASLCLMVGFGLALRATEYDRQALIVGEALKLQGKWELTAEETAGKVLKFPPEGERESMTILTVRGTDFDITIRSVKVDGLPQRVDGGRFKMIPSSKGAIDLLSSMPEKQERPGIYECDGDALKLCLAPLGTKERPVNFTTKDTKNTLYVFARRHAEPAAAPDRGGR